MKLAITIFLLLCIHGSFSQSRLYNIVSFGAIPNSNKVATTYIQHAIDECNKKGGGEIIVPPGVFMVGTIYLKSNIHLILQAGAIIRGSKHLTDYEKYTPSKPYTPVHKGMFFTQDANNITISGDGLIDGNGDAFFLLNKAKKLDKDAVKYTRQKSNFRKVEEGIGDGPVVPLDRPYQMFVFSNCKNVTVRDIKITTAPFWCMHFADCDGVSVNHVRLFNNLLAPNADGIDVTSCSNVIIDGCDIRSGDDAIAIVGYDHHFEIPGFKYLKHNSENIIVSNCNLQSYSSAIRIGHLDQNSVKNIQVSNINITNSTRGIGIFCRDEGSLENITFSNIFINTHIRTGDWWGNGEPIHISAVRGKEGIKMGGISHVIFNNIICNGENGLLIYGSDESIIHDITFNHIRFELTDSRLNEVAGGNIDLSGASVEKHLFQSDIAGLMAKNVDGIYINDFTLTWTNTRLNYFNDGIWLSDFKNVEIRNFRGSHSPINSSAHAIYAEKGENLFIDYNKDVLVSNVLNYTHN